MSESGVCFSDFTPLEYKRKFMGGVLLETEMQINEGEFSYIVDV